MLHRNRSLPLVDLPMSLAVVADVWAPALDDVNLGAAAAVHLEVYPNSEGWNPSKVKNVDENTRLDMIKLRTNVPAGRSPKLANDRHTKTDCLGL